MHAQHAPENKALAYAAPGAGEDLDDLNRTLHAYRQTNDERLGQIESRLGTDPVTEEKLARLDAALDATNRRLDRSQIEKARPALGGNERDRRDPAQAEHKAAFDLYVRAGEAGGLKGLEAKALSAGSGPDGGYLVPETVETEVLTRLANISPIRSIASVRIISAGLYKRAVSVSGPASGWVGETAARPQTAAPGLSELAFPAMELYAMPAATQTLLDDAVVNIDSWLADEVETAFATQEGAAFVNGDGVNRPKGFLAAPTVAESAWTWGSLGYLSTGAAGAFVEDSPADILVELVYALKAGYRQNARFVMNRRTQSEVRKMKDGTGAYLWQPPGSLGQPATVMSFPVVEAEDMPNIGAGSLSIAFGDFRRGYLVVDRAGIRVLRNPYSAKPYVLFYQAAEEVSRKHGLGVIHSLLRSSGCHMRGREDRSSSLFSYIRLDERVPADHPLRPIRALADEVLAGLNGRFEVLYSGTGRPSIPPEMLLRATLLQAFFSVRSERMLMEQIDYNLLFRWFVGLEMDAAVWHPTVFTHNRDRLLEAEVARAFLAGLLELRQVKRLLSSDHFSVDGTLIDAWASMKSFRPKDGSGEPPGPGRNGERDFRKEKRSNETHASTTDPDARLYRKAAGRESRLCFMGHALMENRNGLVVDATLTHATGTAEREATLTMLDRRRGRHRITLGADKAYDVEAFVGDLRTRQVTPHIAINGAVSKTGKVRKTAVDGRTTRHVGYAISQRCRKRIEEVFGWIKVQAGFAKVKVRTRAKVEAVFTFAAAAYNLIRIPKLLAETPA